MTIAADLPPLCTRHRRTRMAAVILRGRAQGSEEAMFGCNVPGCSIHYHNESGYSEVTSGKISFEALNKGRCTEHSTWLRLDSYQPDTQEEVWCCPEAECSTEQIVRRPRNEG